MKIEKKIIKNKTFRFLVPILVVYGLDFIRFINRLKIYAFGISNKGIEFEENSIFILVDTLYNVDLLAEFANWLPTKSFYLGDYHFGNINKTNKHMFVIKFPNEFCNAYDNFIQGKYSKMYTDTEISKYFKDSISKKILTKSKGAEFMIVNEIDKEFGKNIITINDILSDLDNWEFSLPPLKDNENF